MDCASIRDAFLAGEPPGQAARVHAAGCGACAELLARDGTLGSALGSLRDAEDQAPAAGAARALLAGERGAFSWARSRPTRARVRLAVLATAAVTVGAFILTPRADLAVYPQARMAFVVLAHVVLLGALTRLALRGLHLPQATDATRAALAAAAILVPLGLAALPMAHADHPASLVGAGSDFVPRAFACFAFGSALAAPLVVVLRALDRRSRLDGVQAALAGGAAGVAGSLAVYLHCPITHVSHMVAGHATVALAVVLVYAGAARWAAS